MTSAISTGLKEGAPGNGGVVAPLAAGHARLLHLAFDLDGTLFDSEGRDFDDPRSIAELTRPHALACHLVRTAASHGHTVSYHTGREEVHRALTWQQIERASLPAGPLYMNTKWEGYEAMARTKAASLRLFKADLYVGDHQADANAALLAGIPFHHANHWRRGHIPQGIIPPLNNLEEAHA